MESQYHRLEATRTDLAHGAVSDMHKFRDVVKSHIDILFAASCKKPANESALASLNKPSLKVAKPVAIHPRSSSAMPHVLLTPEGSSRSQSLRAVANVGANSQQPRWQPSHNLKQNQFQVSDEFENTSIGKPSPVAVAAVAAAAAVKRDRSVPAAATAAATSQELPVPRPQSPSWRTEGPHLGRRIVRTVDGGVVVRGIVVGWLSAIESDFTDANGQPAGLWRVRYDSEGPLAGDEEDFEEHEIVASTQAELASAGVNPTAAPDPATPAPATSSKTTAATSSNRNKGKKGASAPAVLQQPRRHALLVEKTNGVNLNAASATTVASAATAANGASPKRQRKSQSGSQQTRRRGSSVTTAKRKGKKRNPSPDDGDEASSSASSDELPSTAAESGRVVAEMEISSNPYVVGRSTCGALELWAADRPKTPPVVHTSPRLGARPSRAAPPLAAAAAGKGVGTGGAHGSRRANAGSATSSAAFHEDGGSSSSSDDDDDIDSVSSADEGECEEGTLAAIGHRKRHSRSDLTSLQTPSFAPISDEAAVQSSPPQPSHALPTQSSQSLHPPREYCGVSRSAVEALAASGALSPKAAQDLLRPPVVAKITRSTPEVASAAAAAAATVVEKAKSRVPKERLEKKCSRGNEKGARAGGSNRKSANAARARTVREDKKQSAAKEAREAKKASKVGTASSSKSQKAQGKGIVKSSYESSSSSDEDEDDEGSRRSVKSPQPTKPQTPSQPLSLMELFLKPPPKKKKKKLALKHTSLGKHNRDRTAVKAKVSSSSSSSSNSSSDSDSDSNGSTSSSSNRRSRKGYRLKRSMNESKNNSRKVRSRSVSRNRSSSSGDSSDDRTESDNTSSDSDDDASFEDGQTRKASSKKLHKECGGGKEDSGWSDADSSGSEYRGPRGKKQRTSRAQKISKAQLVAPASVVQKLPTVGDEAAAVKASVGQKHYEKSQPTSSSHDNRGASAKKSKSSASERATAAKVAKAAAAAHAADVAAARAREVAAAAEVALAAGPRLAGREQDGLFETAASRGWERMSEPSSNILPLPKHTLAAASSKIVASDSSSEPPVSLMASRTAVAVEGSNTIWNPHSARAATTVADASRDGSGAPLEPPKRPMTVAALSAQVPPATSQAIPAPNSIHRQPSQHMPSQGLPREYSRSPYTHPQQPPMPHQQQQQQQQQPPEQGGGGPAAPHDLHSRHRVPPLPLPTAMPSPYNLHASAHPHRHPPAAPSAGYPPPHQGQRFSSGALAPHDKGHMYASPAPPWTKGTVGVGPNFGVSQSTGGQPPLPRPPPPAAGYGKPPPIAGTQPYPRHPHPNNTGPYLGSGSDSNGNYSGASNGSYKAHQRPSPYPTAVAGMVNRTVGMRPSPYPRTFGASPTPVGMHARWKAGPSPRPISKPAVPPGFLF